MSARGLSYLHEIDSEPEFIKRFIQSDAARPCLVQILGINRSQYWLSADLDTKLLFPSYESKPGDIDLIIGLMYEGIPLTVPLIAMECKFYNFQTEPFLAKRLPAKESGIEQARGLVRLGFDQVYLIYFVCKPPGNGVNFAAWLGGADIQNAVRRILRHPSRNRKTLENVILNEPFGFIIFKWGQVLGMRPETAGGVGVPYFKPCNIEMKELAMKQRKHLAELINEAYKEFKATPYGPLLLNQCRNCKKLFFSDCLPRAKEIPNLCGKCYASKSFQK